MITLKQLNNRIDNTQTFLICATLAILVVGGVMNWELYEIKRDIKDKPDSQNYDNYLSNISLMQSEISELNIYLGNYSELSERLDKLAEAQNLVWKSSTIKEGYVKGN